MAIFYSWHTISIYQLQGLALDEAVLDIDRNDFSLLLIYYYADCSRVRKMTDLIIWLVPHHWSVAWVNKDQSSDAKPMDDILSLAYRISIHQVLTLDKAVLDIDRNALLLINILLLYADCSRDWCIIWPVLQHWSFSEIYSKEVYSKSFRVIAYFEFITNSVWLVF